MAVAERLFRLRPGRGIGEYTLSHVLHDPRRDDAGLKYTR